MTLDILKELCEVSKANGGFKFYFVDSLLNAINGEGAVTTEQLSEALSVVSAELNEYAHWYAALAEDINFVESEERALEILLEEPFW